MNGFDLLVIAIVAASAILAFLRGIVKELLALASWVIGLIGALVFAGPVGDLLPEMFAGVNPWWFGPSVKAGNVPGKWMNSSIMGPLPWRSKTLQFM